MDTTADLRYCKVYVSALDKRDVKDLIRGLKSAAGFLRRELAKRMTLRYTPELIFTPDDSIDQGNRIIGMLGKLKDAEPVGPQLGPAGADRRGRGRGRMTERALVQWLRQNDNFLILIPRSGRTGTP